MVIGQVFYQIIAEFVDDFVAVYDVSICSFWNGHISKIAAANVSICELLSEFVQFFDQHLFSIHN